MMSDPNQVQGSNAELAEGGLNPEASFAEVDRASAHRMAREAKGAAGGDKQLAESVRQQLKNTPGGKGAAFGRDEYGPRT